MAKPLLIALKPPKTCVLLKFFLMLYETQPYTVSSVFLRPTTRGSYKYLHDNTGKLLGEFSVKETLWLLRGALKIIQDSFLKMDANMLLARKW